MKIILCFLSVLSTTTARCQWSAMSESRSSDLRIICSDINSANIFHEVSSISASSRLLQYTFKNSSIKNFPMNVFTWPKKVSGLYINNSQIETIQTGAFSGLLEVREIYLQFNSLNVISRGCFNSLFKLQILDLSNNNIQLIEDDAFNGSNELKTIFLNNNNITYMPRLLFQSLKQLQVVNVSFNNIQKFDLSFSNFAVFKTIDLNNNQISSINCEVVSVSFLDIVKLENNVLVRLNGSCLPKIVEELVLKNNIIREIGNVTALSNLKYLDLSNNEIDILRVDEFRGLKNLVQLKIPNNKISKLAPGIFKDLARLTLLDLSGNSIKLLDFGVFNGLQKLDNLDVSYNQLEVLEEDVFHNLNRLGVLNVSYNNLQYINLVKLKSYSNSLRQVNLIGNNISCQRLSAIFSYRISIDIVRNSYHNVSNVNGIPCTNFNIQYNTNVSKLNSNIFREIRLFFESDFKNTTFFKFFSKQSHFNESESNKNNLTGTFLGFRSYLNETNLNNHNLDKNLNKIVTQMSKNNTVFIIFTFILAVICALLLTLIVLLKKKLQNNLPTREAEMHLL